MAENFPKDAWYAVGGAAMLAEGEVMPVKLFGEERVAWRGDDGESHVWHNRCIHRGMRLQYGFVDGDRLACRYHGWRFGGDAQCKKIPAHPTMAPPDDFRIPVFQSAEKNGLVWTTAGTPGANVTGLPGSENFIFWVAPLPFTRRRMPSLSISETWMHRLQRREFYRRS